MVFAVSDISTSSFSMVGSNSLLQVNPPEQGNTFDKFQEMAEKSDDKW